MTKSLASRFGFLSVVAFLILVNFSDVAAQDAAASNELSLYNQTRLFALTGGAVDVRGLVLKKDRIQLTLDGVVYLSAQTNGQSTGAVFIGDGKFVAETPPNDFEKDNLKRLLGAEVVESDFKTAVFRFTDDTAQQLGAVRNEPVNDRAQKLALEMERRILKETGANLSARIVMSILNGEKPGFFFANFDGGKRGRFSFLLDHQTRIPVANFGINAGEKGLLFSYSDTIMDSEVWTAFYSIEDYQRGQVQYSDANDLINVTGYDMEVDLREHKKRLRLVTRVSAQTLQPNLRVISFNLGEGLGVFEDERLKKQMRVKSVKRGGTDQLIAQEDWEGGFTVFLSEPIAAAGAKLELDMELEGDFMYDAKSVSDCHYPRSTETWFPRHGYLDRATFNLTYRHPKRLKIASVGARLSEEQNQEERDTTIARYEMKQPVPLVTFALAPFKRHAESIKWEKGGAPTPLEFNSLSGAVAAIKEDFILAELNNSVRYFTVHFGDYPYPAFNAAFHPFEYGQGFPSLLMIPGEDSANKHTYSFIAHETAHQWWGGIVAWRSYRDQWLSEGFAEYSGMLYTGMRDGPGSKDELISRARESLRLPPITPTGPGKGRLVDVGPIILGHRLDTTKTFGTYEALIYNKGALVLRMLHYMLSDPSSGNGQPFFDMMTDFVTRYRNQTASTEDFRAVVNEHFVRTPIAQKYRLKDLNWFFHQTVYNTALPAYEMQYRIEDQPDGKVLVSGTVTQQNTPAQWAMILPVVFTFGNNQHASGTVMVEGPSSTFQIRLPMRPKKVELDPEHWILSERTATKGN